MESVKNFQTSNLEWSVLTSDSNSVLTLTPMLISKPLSMSILVKRKKSVATSDRENKSKKHKKRNKNLESSRHLMPKCAPER